MRSGWPVRADCSYFCSTWTRWKTN
ncbi:hypothetical protein PSPO01_16235 [Paraphaeosphaeria sporulosa]